MKTLTEFSGFVLKEALVKKASLLAEGKTEEEAQAAINEQLKLDETKVGFFKNVVDMTGSRRDAVKRVVVAVKATETETVPTAFMEREGHFYLVEYFPQAGGKQPSREDDRSFGRGGDRKGGGRDGGGRPGGGRGDSRGPRSDRGGGSDSRDNRRATKGFHSDIPAPVTEGAARPPRGPRPPRAPRAPRPEGSGAPSPFRTTRPEGAPATAPRGPRPPRAPRAPRPEGAPKGPKGAGELRLVLKGQSSQTLQGSGTNESATAGSTDTPQA